MHLCTGGVKRVVRGPLGGDVPDGHAGAGSRQQRGLAGHLPTAGLCRRSRCALLEVCTLFSVDNK